MFCQYCGTEVPEGFLFCSKCGQKVSMPGTPSPDNNVNTKRIGKCLFAIEQKKRLYITWPSAIKVYIDGNLEKKLSNGGYFSKILDNGKHKLYLAIGEPGKQFHVTQSLEFTGDDNEIAFFVDIRNSLKDDALVIKKIKETQPGTLHEMEDLKL